MSRGRAEDLWARYLDGQALTPEEKLELRRALEKDPTLQADFFEDKELHGLLGASGLTEDEARQFADAFLERIILERDATKFVRLVDSRIGQESPSDPKKKSTRRARTRQARGVWEGSVWKLCLAAAAIFVAVVGVLTIASSGPSPDRSRDSARRRKDELAERVEPPRSEPKEKAPEPPEPGKRAVPVKPSEKEDDLRQKAEEAFAESARKLQQEEERLRKPKDPEPKPDRPAETPAAPRPSTPEKPPTAAAVATVERAEKEAYAVSEGQKRPLRAGDAILSGHGLETRTQAVLVLLYPDRSKVELGAETVLREHSERGGKDGVGKWYFVERGALRAQVSRQPKDQATRIATAYGEATVLGTTLRITVDPDPKKGMRLEVEEGKVRLKHLDGKTVDVPAGHFAVAAAGVELASKPFSAMEIPARPDGLPYDRTCPVVYDNDGVRDVYADEYVLALASAGEISLRGIITSSTYPASWTKEYITDRVELVAKARRSGMRNLPDPVLGCTKTLRQPPTGRIEDTRPLLSQGTLLMVEQARRATPQRPLVVLTGGALTTVADAFLVNSSIADRVVVASMARGTTKLEGAKDPWASFIVLERLRYVHFTVPPPPVSPTDFAELPDTEFRRALLEKANLVSEPTRTLFGDGVPCVSLMRADYVLRSRRVTFNQWVPSEDAPSVQVPGFKDDPNGRAWVVSEARPEVGVEELRRALRNPAVWGLKSSK